MIINIPSILVLFLFQSCVSPILINSDREVDYYANGNMKYDITYKNGKIDGEAKYWSSDGYLINMVNYVNDQFHGEWIDYYKNGKTQHIINYAYGKKNGKEIWYHESGNIKSQVLYDNDKIISDIVRWDNNGKVIYE
jgi:antitoxin component YwqK of YwqJK toxin-antitoxin module